MQVLNSQEIRTIALSISSTEVQIMACLVLLLLKILKIQTKTTMALTSATEVLPLGETTRALRSTLSQTTAVNRLRLKRSSLSKKSPSLFQIPCS